jgi:hypothetical protein
MGGNFEINMKHKKGGYRVDMLDALLAAALLVDAQVYLLYDLSRQMPGEGLILIKDKLRVIQKRSSSDIHNHRIDYK